MENMKDRVTIYEVAKTAKVSLATVSRVINNKGNVTDETRIRVEEAIAKLGYKPSSLAQGLATSKTTNIAIILPAANYVYISNMLSGMIDVGRIYGYRCTDEHLVRYRCVRPACTGHRQQDAPRPGRVPGCSGRHWRSGL